MPNHLFRAWNTAHHPTRVEEDPAFAEYRASWLKRFPESKPDPRSDLEDFGEHVSSLVAFDRLGIQEILLPSNNLRAIGRELDGVAINDKGPVGFLYHGFTSGDSIVPFDPPTRIIGQDAKTLDFISHATDSPLYMEAIGRKMMATGVDPEEVNAAVRDIIGDEGKIFLKTIKKEMSATFDIKPGRSPWDQMIEQEDGLMWEPIHHEGAKRFFLIQEAMEPVDEYRFHVLGDQVVTGSACWSPFIPLHHQPSEHGAFDPRLAPNAFCAPEELRRDEHMVGEYLDFAQRLARGFKAETGHLMAYTIDVCVDKKQDMIKLIEINPQLNAGRYGADANHWVKTVADTLDQIEQRERQQSLAIASQQQLGR